jgi:hypothetical protein
LHEGRGRSFRSCWNFDAKPKRIKNRVWRCAFKGF